MTLSLRLTRSQFAVLQLVKKYFETTGRDYLTYDSIKVFAAKSGFYREYRISDRTIDRALRRLAELKLFTREERIVFDKIQERRKRVVYYYPTDLFYTFFSKQNKGVRA